MIIIQDCIKSKRQSFFSFFDIKFTVFSTENYQKTTDVKEKVEVFQKKVLGNFVTGKVPKKTWLR